ncbi:hypothetical protein FNV43_RR09077 [Rhamnella rubrinervis]|uniref:Bifunctional inhibitor/plant lipid transfer protein/seed storage helical domain-containing protein n=1 Tax=Rhamnella rubrinervis TaxID=2594499 RepID=A0A8K0HAJ1_9ROSA|nr:hypothetical protein FNV43_RR09077 [Rhamnella rubrinervis]
MASKALASTALLLSLNILFFTMVSSCGTCSTPSVPPPKPAANTCPKDTLKIGACVKVLKGDLVNLVLGNPPSGSACCPLIAGLADLEAAICLCTTIKLNVLNVVNLNVPVDLSLILSDCHKEVPSGYKCS